MVVIVSTVIGAAAVATISYLLWPTWTPAGANDPARLPISIGNTLFNVPTPAVRISVQRRTGPQDRVDLAFSYPSLAPGVETRHVSIDTVEQTPQSIDVIFLSIAAHGSALAPEERARTIYPRYVETAATVDDGLARRAFRDPSPYANEDLFIATTPALIARCSRDGETPGICLSERRLNGADLTFRFPRAWLSDWRNVAAAMQHIVDDIYKPRA
ncbi:MAG: hypothetical protein ACLP1D_18215 [Xanthobacteraceae bacterium]